MPNPNFGLNKLNNCPVRDEVSCLYIVVCSALSPKISSTLAINAHHPGHICPNYMYYLFLFVNLSHRWHRDVFNYQNLHSILHSTITISSSVIHIKATIIIVMYMKIT